MALFAERAELAFDIVPRIMEMAGMAEYTRHIEEMKAQLRGLQGVVSGGQNANVGGGRGAQALGIASTVGVTGAAAVMGFGVLSTKDAMETERSANQIIAAHDKVRRHQEEFTRWIEQNSTELRTSQINLWNGIGDTIEYNFGVRGTETVTAGVAKMTKVLGGEFTSNVQNVTGILGALHVTAAQIPQTLDQLTAAASRSGQGSAFFSTGLARLLVQAQGIGASTGESLGIASELSKLGLGNRAEGAFGTLLQRLGVLGQTQGYGNIVDVSRFGIVGSLQNVLNAPNADETTIRKLLGGNISETLAKRLVQAGPQAASLGNTQGTLNNDWQTYVKSAAGDLDKLTTAVSNVEEAFGKGLVPILGTVAGDLTIVADGAQRITETFPGQSKAIMGAAVAVGLLSVGYKGLAAIYGPVFELAGKARTAIAGETAAETAETASASRLEATLAELNLQLVALNKNLETGTPALDAEAAGIGAIGAAAATADPEVAALVANLRAVDLESDGVAAKLDAEAGGIGAMGVASDTAAPKIGAFGAAATAAIGEEGTAAVAGEVGGATILTGATGILGMAAAVGILAYALDNFGPFKSAIQNINDFVASLGIGDKHSEGTSVMDVIAQKLSKDSGDHIVWDPKRQTFVDLGVSSKSNMILAAGGTKDLNPVSLPSDIAQWAGPIQKYAAKDNVPASVIAAIVLGESSGDPFKSSPLGSQYGEGLMMVGQAAAKQVGGQWAPNPKDVAPDQQIKQGTDYFAWILHGPAHGDLRTAMIMYIAGPYVKVGSAGWKEAAHYVDTVELPAVTKFSRGITQGPSAGQSHIDPSTHRPSGLFGFQETGFIPGQLTPDMAGVENPKTGAWGTADEHWDIDAPAGTKVYMIGDSTFKCQCIGIITNSLDGMPLISLMTLPDKQGFTIAHMAWKGLRIRKGSIIHGGDFIGYLAVEPKLGPHLHVAVTWGAERDMMAHTPKANWVVTQGSSASGYGSQEGPGGASVYTPAAAGGYTPLPQSAKDTKGSLQWWEARLSTDESNFNAIYAGVDPTKLQGPQKDAYVRYVQGIAEDKYQVAVATIDAQTWMSPAQKAAAIATAKNARNYTDTHAIAYKAKDDPLNKVVQSEQFDLGTIQTRWSGVDPTKLKGADRASWLKDQYRADELQRQIADNTAKIAYHAHTISLQQLHDREAADNRAKNAANQAARAKLDQADGLGPVGRIAAERVTGQCAAEERANVHRKKTEENTKAAAAAGSDLAKTMIAVSQYLQKREHSLDKFTSALLRLMSGDGAGSRARAIGLKPVPQQHR